jgi:hypothetical protein
LVIPYAVPGYMIVDCFVVLFYGSLGVVMPKAAMELGQNMRSSFFYLHISRQLKSDVILSLWVKRGFNYPVTESSAVRQ